ncbi:hypothetical protein PZA11_008026 [Diplocarpon coronariae]
MSRDPPLPGLYTSKGRHLARSYNKRKFIISRFSNKPIGYQLIKERFNILKIGNNLIE